MIASRTWSVATLGATATWTTAHGRCGRAVVLERRQIFCQPTPESDEVTATAEQTTPDSEEMTANSEWTTPIVQETTATVEWTTPNFEEITSICG